MNAFWVNLTFALLNAGMAGLMYESGHQIVAMLDCFAVGVTATLSFVIFMEDH